MKKNAHNIICLEVEWLYNSNRKGERFNLKTEPLLNWLKEFHQCDVIYRHILHKADLQHYLDYFHPSKRDFKNHEIVYLACHGRKGNYEKSAPNKVELVLPIVAQANGGSNGGSSKVKDTEMCNWIRI